MLGEANQNLCSTVARQPDEIDVRFSLPNWVDIAEGAMGRGCYKQAAEVACHMFGSDREAWLRSSRPSREQWRSSVQDALEALEVSDDSPIDTDRHGFRTMLQGHHDMGNGIKFRFVAESSAAGLAGLRATEDEESRYLKKILVVDIGAGSTDIGYVIRSPLKNDSGPAEALCQLPPANTCQVAGEDLTRRIVEIYRSRGGDHGFDEAERIKTVGEDQEWLTHPAVTDWIRGIAEHVRRYVSDIPDKRWLPEMPGLQVLITGGSGVVAGLREAVISATTDGLRHGGIPVDVINVTTPMILRLEGPAERDVNRLAVAIGAASEDLPRLAYFQTLDPPMLRPTVRVPRPWTG